MSVDPTTAGRRYEDVEYEKLRQAATWREQLPYGLILSPSPFLLAVEQFFKRVDNERPFEPLYDDDGERMSTARWVTKPLKEFRIDNLVAGQYEMGANQLQFAVQHSADRYPFGDPHPLVVVYQGTEYLLDGHHRTIAERIAGKEMITARYIVRSKPGPP